MWSAYDTGGSLRRRIAGFSLMEVVIALAIGMVLATSVGVGYYGRTLARRRLDAAAMRLIADVHLAQQQAVQTSAAKTMIFSASSYSVAGIQHLDRSINTYTVDLAAEPYLARIGVVNLGGDNEIVFDLYGAPDSGGQISLSVGDYAKTVTIDAQTGRASAP